MDKAKRRAAMQITRFREIAQLFHDSLSGEFERVFDQVIFAIVDGSEGQCFIGPFQHLFGETARAEQR